MADSSLSDMAKQEKAKEIRHAAMEQARSVLTPEQREQLKANRSARRAERAQSPSM
jgi:Spy/CpxP family protein refolding chaperone